MKTVQHFNDEYLERCCQATIVQILEYLENFRLMHSNQASTKLISLMVRLKYQVTSAYC